MKDIVIFVSVVLYLAFYFPYIKQIYLGKIKPRPLSWLGWSLLLGIGVFSQIIQVGFNKSMIIVIAAGIGCFITFLAALIKSSSKNKLMDYICFCLGIICFVIYLLTKDAVITTMFAVAADLLVGIPTIWNVYKNPASEDKFSWGLSTAGIFLSFLVVITESGSLIKVFPTYLLIFNLTIFMLCFRRFNYLKN